MLFKIRRRSQVSLFLARVGRTCTLAVSISWSSGESRRHGRTKPTPRTSTWSRGSASDRRVRVEGLVVGSAYKVRVAACNAVGRGPWSPWTPDIHVTEECVGDPLDKWG